MEQPLRRTASAATRSGEMAMRENGERSGVAWYGGTERPLKSFAGSGKRFLLLFLFPFFF